MTPPRRTSTTSSSSRVGFGVVVRLWRLLGTVDENECLTELGWWGLPEALDRAWRPRADGG